MVNDHDLTEYLGFVVRARCLSTLLIIKEG